MLDTHNDRKDNDILDDVLNTYAYQCHDSERSKYEPTREEYSVILAI